MSSSSRKVLLLAALTYGVSGCWVAYISPAPNGNSNKPKLNPKKAVHSSSPGKKDLNFHQILERVGKTILRPGGSRATRTLQQNAGLSSDDTVLEMSAGLGSSGLLLAQQYGCNVLLTDIDESRLAKGADRAHRLGLDHLVSTRKMDMFDLDQAADDNDEELHFDAAMTEASITHFPHSQKVQFFEGVSRHSSKFLLHEICFKTTNQEIQEATKRDMAKVLRIGFYPETVETWQKLLEDAGYTVEETEVGNLAVLNPWNIIEDEGLGGFLKIAYNLATKPYLRSRVLATRRTIDQHKDDLGYVIINASKKKKK